MAYRIKVKYRKKGKWFDPEWYGYKKIKNFRTKSLAKLDIQGGKIAEIMAHRFTRGRTSKAIAFKVIKVKSKQKKSKKRRKK